MIVLVHGVPETAAQPAAPAAPTAGHLRRQAPGGDPVGGRRADRPRLAFGMGPTRRGATRRRP